MISLRTIKLAVMLSLSVASAASAISLGFDFADDVDPAAMGPTDVAGVVPQANWNTMFGNVGDAVGGNVADNNGTAVNSTATISWTSNNTWSTTRPGEMNNNFPEGGDRILMTGYLDSTDQAAGATTVTVNNIDAALRMPSYDVLVYMANGFSGTRGGGFTLTAGTNTQVKYGSTGVGPTMHVKDPGTDMDNTIHGSYLHFPGLTAPSFTLTADASLTTPGGFRATIAGIQIVPPLPVFREGDVDGDGDVDMTDFNAIRDNFQMSVTNRNRGDLDEDGFVDFTDFRQWKNNFPFPPAGSAASAAVPEPTVWMLSWMALAGVVALWRRQRRA
jgi:hypothetical protein